MNSSYKEDWRYIKLEFNSHIVSAFLGLFNASDAISCTLSFDHASYAFKEDYSLLIYAGTCLRFLLKMSLPAPVILNCTHSTNIQLAKLKKKLVSCIPVVHHNSKVVGII